MAYIYKITNAINQKSYIGKTEQRNPENRWKEHQRENKKPRSSSRTLYRALNKYGIENFIFTILEETNEPNKREKYYIQYFNTYHNGYNETLGGDGSSYLELPEQEICDFYLQTKSLSKTGLKFGCDPKTVDKILYKNNIEKFSFSEAISNSITNKKSVAQIDKNTNEVLAVFNSIADAERAISGSGHIKDVCNGKRKTTGGFKWQFI